MIIIFRGALCILVQDDIVFNDFAEKEVKDIVFNDFAVKRSESECLVIKFVV